MALKEKILDRAQKYIQRGALDKAVIEYKAALDVDPRDISIRLRVGDLYVKMGKKPDAIKEYTEVAKANSQRGFYLKAIAVYKQVLKLDESVLDIHYKLAELYSKQRLIADAISEYSYIVSAFERRGKTAEVMELLKKMVEIDSENIGVRIKLAELYQRLSFEKDAIEEYCWIFERLVAHGKLDKAEKVFINVYNMNPREPRVLKGLAGLYRHKGDEAHYIRFSKALFELYKDSGDTANAKAVCEEILCARPDDDEALKYLGHFKKSEEAEREKALAEEKRKEDAHSKEQAGTERASEEAPLIEFPAEEIDEEAEEPLIAFPELDVEISIEGFEEPEKALEEPVAQTVTETAAEPIREAVEELSEKAVPEPAPPSAEEPVRVVAETAVEEGYVEIDVPGVERLEPAFRFSGEEPIVKIPDELPEGAQYEALEEEPVKEEPAVEVLEIKKEEPEEAPLMDIESPEAGPAEEPLIITEVAAEAHEPSEALAEPAPVEAAPSGTTPVEEAPEAAPAETGIAEVADEAEVPVPVIEAPETEAEEEPEFQLKERPAVSFPAEGEKASAPVHIEMAQRVEVHEAVVHPEEGDWDQEKVQFEIKESYPATAHEFERAKKEEKIELSEFPELKGEEAGQEAEEDLSAAITELMEKMSGEEAELHEVKDAAAQPEGALIEEAEERRPEDMLIETERVRMEEKGAEKKEEYVDLSAELGLEEALEDLAGSWQGGESKEAFDEFKSGIGQQLSKEDTETHYNLGIAYMEMELFNEASKEFKIALKDPRLEFDCYIRLGLSSMAISEPQEAIVYYLKGLKIEGASPDERKGMMYELALAYEAAGDAEEAMQLFSSIHSQDPEYREVASKIKEFAARRPYIPLDDGLIEVELL